MNMENVIVCDIHNLDDYEFAGIYMFRNKINNKCYIGQSINIKKRLKGHLRCFVKCIADTTIHKAFLKYNIENFEIIILEKLEFCDEIKIKLDELEKYYIQKYDSYKNGYNSTLGGDAGVLGLKMNEEQLNKMRRNGIIYSKNKCREIFVEDIKNNILYRFTSITRAALKLNLHRSNLSNATTGKYLMLNNQYIAAYTLNELKEKRIQARNVKYKSGKFVKGDPRCVGKKEFRHRKSHECPEHQKELLKEYASKYNYELYYKTGEYINTYTRQDYLLKEFPDVTNCIFKAAYKAGNYNFANYKDYKIRRIPKQNNNNV